MSFRSLLVALDGPRNDARIHLASQYAAAHGTHLLGVAPTGLLDVDTGSFAAARTMDEANMARLAALQNAEDRVREFRARCRAEGITSVEAEIHEGSRAAVVLHHAHCADLTVVGQPDPAATTYREDKRFIEEILLHNARPTLVVPHGERFAKLGERVLVAWDDSRGSARAVADAMPLLRDASSVRLRVWRRRTEAVEAVVRERLDAVRRWLRWQDVEVDVGLEVAENSIAATILDTAADIGADLIVMGSYGHSRWTERLMGGTTRTVLARTTLPLLMSH